VKLRLELEPKWAGGIQANLLDALRRAARADTLEVAEAIIRKSGAGGQAIVSRGARELLVCCVMALAGPVRCATIVYAARQPLAADPGSASGLARLAAN